MEYAEISGFKSAIKILSSVSSYTLSTVFWKLLTVSLLVRLRCL